MGRYIEYGYNVTKFLHHFQRCLSRMRNNEMVKDFKSSYGDELLQTPYHNIEGQTASIYTRVVFKEFHEIISTQQTSTHVIYKIGKHYSPNKKWHVSHYDNGSNVDIKCSCKGMKSFGMPCSHSVFVLLILDISQLSYCLVLERWIKKTKDVQDMKLRVMVVGPNKKWHVSHYDNGSNVNIKCSCKEMKSFGMPCSHSVFVLLILDISQLSSCLVLERWIKKTKDVQGVNFQQCELNRE
ncbi:hypothetical protein Lal_00028427 [Lupinus albus]|nr:hypothetical protein Lal_00028427 [Lupinus albus]